MRINPTARDQRKHQRRLDGDLKNLHRRPGLSASPVPQLPARSDQEGEQRQENRLVEHKLAFDALRISAKGLRLA